jgi:hypothetical protein
MLFISATTRERLRTSIDELSLVGEVTIRGRTGRLAVWTIWPDGVGAVYENGQPGQHVEGRSAGSSPTGVRGDEA